MITSSPSIVRNPSPKTSWQAEENIDIQRVTQKAIIHELTQQQTRTIESVVPWFLDTMPTCYFRQVPECFRMDHIKAISAVKDANMDLHMNLQSQLPDGRYVLTFLRPGAQPGRLLELVEDLPWNQNSEGYLPLSRVQVFSAQDGSLSLSMFVYGEERTGDIDVKVTGSRILKYAEAVQNGDYSDDKRNPEPSDLFDTDKIIEYLHQCSETYITRSDPRRFLKQRVLFDKVSGTEGIAVSIEESTMDDEHAAEGRYWIDIAVANSLPQVALENSARLLFQHKFDVVRAHLDMVSDGYNGNVTLLRLLVCPTDKEAENEETFRLLKQEIKRSKWLDPTTMKLVFERYPWLGISRGEIITAFCSLMHPVMGKENPLAYSKANIFEAVTKERYIAHSASITDLFLDRFNPNEPMSDEELDARSEQLRKKIDGSVEDTTASELLNKMIDIVKHTLRTNIYLADRYSLGLRLDPKIMVGKGEHRELPYGVLFAHGRRFNAYHVRFRDISRGGLRLVTPQSSEQHALESARQYDECYGLAFAQQLKNKDIPEGGSKAVNLIDVVGLSNDAKNFVVRKSVKAFTDTILDLIVETQHSRKHMVDLLGKKEVLYLGPDEQVIPEDINWIVKRAACRGYDTPNAFMSSKPRTGINHKEFGVTSEGVNVYLDVALRRTLGIDPTKNSFTIKMTGGPDGDVAGNELKILIREYGKNVKIVGIADHSGCAEDPNGLDHDEIIRLVNISKSISHFDDSKLGVNGVVHRVDTEEGVKARNGMHNRLKADAFVPAGGRPNTINIHNYKQFLAEDGSPSSSLIVEGANLFITAEARQALFEDAGVVIVKDSSANKGGVITSSYEICAAMMLTEEEFFRNKKAIVEEVLAKLRNLARMEATLLFREFENYGGSLPHVSQVISNAINTATDALSIALENLSKEDIEVLLPLFRSHLPPTLADLAFDRIHDKVPEQYIKNAIASCLASKMVYKEGTKFIEAQPMDKLANVALKYIEKEREIAALKEALSDVDMPESEKSTILELLDAGGARTALNLF